MWDHEISVKWPAARLVGPNVTKEQALDYIFRTDAAMRGDCFCNDYDFEKELAALLDYPDWRQWEKREALIAKRGLLTLEHLGSAWVASAFIMGPGGPVHPNGEVRLAENFGKWPAVAEIENDLSIIAPAFPWLTFRLALWDYDSEGDAVAVYPATHAWALESGKWERIEPEAAIPQGQMPHEGDMMAAVNRIAFMPARSRETTWTVEQIKEMWGDRL